jgi:hypothetical protein
MQKLTAGITKAGTGIDDIVWNIFGQIYAPKAVSDSSFSWHATFPPGTFVPPHIHPTQDEFIYMFEGRLDLVIDGRDVVAGRSGPHADGPAARYFQQVGSASEMFFLGVTDAQALRLVLGDPFDEGTETRGRRPASGQARSEFSAAAEVTKIAALPYSRSSLTVSATNLPSAESSQRLPNDLVLPMRIGGPAFDLIRHRRAAGVLTPSFQICHCRQAILGASRLWVRLLMRPPSLLLIAVLLGSNLTRAQRKNRTLRPPCIRRPVLHYRTTDCCRWRPKHHNVTEKLCPLWVKSRHFSGSLRCPLFPRKRTLLGDSWMSALCQKRTRAPQQKRFLFAHLVGKSGHLREQKSRTHLPH